ncbi:hypothetical protein NB724_002685 [Pantoea ananatis]|nr:hypothetical protein [Pantoea ananatis]MCW0335703.1 hypothetical protein [Pantoea ananatis]MCW0383668.1 hypothetical protein [Pantoea ananatis]MCW0408311.1 hypothetical protein [Pantoea ananatis]MCW0428536.1 hypothetical protein [Pantoea ananatis]
MDPLSSLRKADIQGNEGFRSSGNDGAKPQSHVLIRKNIIFCIL